MELAPGGRFEMTTCNPNLSIDKLSNPRIMVLEVGNGNQIEPD